MSKATIPWNGPNGSPAPPGRTGRDGKTASQKSTAQFLPKMRAPNLVVRNVRRLHTEANAPTLRRSQQSKKHQEAVPDGGDDRDSTTRCKRVSDLETFAAKDILSKTGKACMGAADEAAGRARRSFSAVGGCRAFEHVLLGGNTVHAEELGGLGHRFSNILLRMRGKKYWCCTCTFSLCVTLFQNEKNKNENKQFTKSERPLLALHLRKNRASPHLSLLVRGRPLVVFTAQCSTRHQMGSGTCFSFPSCNCHQRSSHPAPCVGQGFSSPTP